MTALTDYLAAASAAGNATLVETAADGSTIVLAYTQGVTPPDVPGLPGYVATPLAALLAAVQAGMAASAGVVANLAAADQAAIAAAAQATIAAAQPMIAMGLPGLSTACAQAAAYAANIAAICAAPSQARWQIRVINPCLPLIAAQYLGDPGLWQRISDFNGLDPDPQPIGSFTLSIPAP